MPLYRAIGLAGGIVALLGVSGACSSVDVAESARAIEPAESEELGSAEGTENGSKASPGGGGATAAPPDKRPPTKDAGLPIDAGTEGGAVDAGGGCAPRTCAEAGATCGSIDDGCGKSIACGGCTAPATCGGGGKANRCGGGSTLADYWAGKARWKFERFFTLPGAWPAGHDTFGAHIEVQDDVWYLFSRKRHIDQQPLACKTSTVYPMSTQVRRSVDRGVTWSAPVDAVPNQAGTAWECAATDGDAIYEAGSNTWHFLFQCLGADGRWNGCHATRVGSDPMGPFTVEPTPVIRSGDLWNQICDVPGDRCSQVAGGPRRVWGEGTFDIFHHDGTHYFVAFHGTDNVRGYRGIAKTSDFRTWIAGNPAQGVPSDAIIDTKDAAGWRETWNPGGNIGGGAGSILREGSTWYQVFEAADLNLACTPGQNWDVGILRSPSLTNTSWEQLPAGNPILYSSKAVEQNGTSVYCNIQYARLFRDSGEIWLHVTRMTVDPTHSGIYLYRLVPDRNLLRNGDLWTCRSDPWKIFPKGPTNLAVYRLPNNATDGNCYLATNCGQTPCESGQSVHQDVPAPSPLPATMKWGGKFLAEGGTGTVLVVIHELGTSGGLLATHQLQVSAGPTWSSASRTFSPTPGATKLRFQLYLSSPLTIRADELFLEPSP